MPIPCHSRRSAAPRDEASTARIASILSRERFDSRQALDRRIREEYSFADARGRPRLAGHTEAFSELARTVPGIVLPPPRALAVRNRLRLPEADLPEPEAVPASGADP